METADTLIVKFWGVRGSHPTPEMDTLKFGGNTACVEVHSGDQRIILDAGTGIIHLGRDLLRQAALGHRAGAEIVMAPVILLSHLHHDHTQGLPFFSPAYLPTARLHIFGPRAGGDELETALAQVWTPPVFPLRLAEAGAVLDIRSLTENQVIRLGSAAASRPEIISAGVELPSAAGDTIIRILRSYAHPGGVFAYRIERGATALVYATDTEGYQPVDRRLAAFAQHADLLIHDAQYTEDHYQGTAGGRSTQGWGHSTARMACDLALAAGVSRLALFHFDPTYSDERVEKMEAEAFGRFSGAFAAREGTQIELGKVRHRSSRRDFRGEDAGVRA